MSEIIKETALDMNAYYRSQFVSSSRSALEGDYTMTFLVKPETDLLAFASAARQVWEADGAYPHSFTGLVKTENGNAFTSFEYKGPLEGG